MLVKANSSYPLPNHPIQQAMEEYFRAKEATHSSFMSGSGDFEMKQNKTKCIYICSDFRIWIVDT